MFWTLILNIQVTNYETTNMKRRINVILSKKTEKISQFCLLELLQNLQNLYLIHTAICINQITCFSNCVIISDNCVCPHNVDGNHQSEIKISKSREDCSPKLSTSIQVWNRPYLAPSPHHKRISFRCVEGESQKVGLCSPFLYMQRKQHTKNHQTLVWKSPLEPTAVSVDWELIKIRAYPSFELGT
jgi:hypothetical protein